MQKTNLFFLCLALLFSTNAALAKRAIKAKTKAPSQGTLSWSDKKVDSMIAKHLGNDFRRAGIYDIYPEIQNTKRNKALKDLAQYFEYTREDLKRISRGEYLKPFILNFDLDAYNDFVAIVHNKKTSDNLLFICNSKNIIYMEKFKATHLELVNYGKYPTTVATKAQKKTINAPAIKLVSFEDTNYVLHYNRNRKSWEKAALLF